jgi:Zn-dependent peptidase ImmA (M78 family)
MDFNPSRLTLARQSLGWTKVRLADEIGITPRRLADYENRGDSPSAGTLQLLAQALNVDEAFFYQGEHQPPENPSFRSLRSMSASVRNMALSAASMTVEVSSWIGERFDLEDVSLPTDLAGVEASLAADVVRQRWALGLQPAPNLVHLAELMGVRVFALAVRARSLDAFSFWDEGTPYILVNARGTAERRRWDVAHELGHLVMHVGSHHLPSDRGREDEADAFASALLLPAEGLRRNPVRARHLDEIREHKLHWKVSAVSLIRALHRQHYLTDWEYRNLAIEASKAKLRRSEDDIPVESSPVLSLVLTELRRRGLGVRSIASDLCLRPVDVQNMFHSLAPVALEDSQVVVTDRIEGHLRVVRP